MSQPISVFVAAEEVAKPPRNAAADQPDSVETGEETRRLQGQPRAVIDMDAVADVVAGLFVEGGANAVPIVNAAKKLDVSRVSLYRMVPRKEDLVGVLLEHVSNIRRCAFEVVKLPTPPSDVRARDIPDEATSSANRGGWSPQLGY